MRDPSAHMRKPVRPTTGLSGYAVRLIEAVIGASEKIQWWHGSKSSLGGHTGQFEKAVARRRAGNKVARVSRRQNRRK